MKKALSPKALLMPALMIFAMWAGFLLQHIGAVRGCAGAIIPHVPAGLFGVLFSPLLHGNWEHIFGNSVPMAVFLFLLYQFYPKAADSVFFLGWLLSGFFAWLFPSWDIFSGEVFSCIIGASGIVYVLGFFLFFSGVFAKDRRLLTVSLLVALYYGSMIWGIVPQEFFYKSPEAVQVSWQSHLIGAVLGIGFSVYFREKAGRRQKIFIWEFPNYYSEKDDKLWQKYVAEHPEDFEEMPKLEQKDEWKILEEIRKKARQE